MRDPIKESFYFIWRKLMEKILKFLKCKDKEEVIYKMRNYEGTQEIEELKELIHYISKEGIKRRDLTTIKNKENLLEFLKINLSPRHMCLK